MLLGLFAMVVTLAAPKGWPVLAGDLTSNFSVAPHGRLKTGPLRSGLIYPGFERSKKNSP